MIFGITYGIVHLVLVNLKVNVPVVPADYCVNAAIATAVQIARISKQGKKGAIPIYAFSSCQSNTVTYGGLTEKCYQTWLHTPTEKMTSATTSITFCPDF